MLNSDGVQFIAIFVLIEFFFYEEDRFILEWWQGFSDGIAKA
jgi:hypothetical protein